MSVAAPTEGGRDARQGGGMRRFATFVRRPLWTPTTGGWPTIEPLAVLSSDSVIWVEGGAAAIPRSSTKEGSKKDKLEVPLDVTRVGSSYREGEWR